MGKPAAIVEIEREISERKAAEKEKHDAEIHRLANETARRIQKEEAERQKAIETEDKRREEHFERELELESRAHFFSGNGGASEETYQSVRDAYFGLT